MSQYNSTSGYMAEYFECQDSIKGIKSITLGTILSLYFLNDDSIRLVLENLFCWFQLYQTKRCRHKQLHKYNLIFTSNLGTFICNFEIVRREWNFLHFASTVHIVMDVRKLIKHLLKKQEKSISSRVYWVVDRNCFKQKSDSVRLPWHISKPCYCSSVDTEARWICFLSH